MRIKITTQNTLPPVKIERERKLLEWTAFCDSLEGELGKPSQANMQQYAKKLEELDAAQTKDYSTVVYRKWPNNKAQLKELLDEMGADVMAIEITEEGVIGVVYV